ncbi:zinc-binding dehydrogenase [Streptomyces sp. NPDC059985]|uniref:zinc-binding dehydrogenase n=1 Tax=Streptomyces sp. NPDC059985 TaxID=3347025 RepID=UPI003680114C
MGPERLGHDLLCGLGADEWIDHTTEDFTHLRDVDVVIDTISNECGPRSLRTLRRGGVLIDVVGVGVDRTQGREQSRANGVRCVEYFLEPTPEDLVGFARLVDDAGVRPSVEETLPLVEAVRAHRLSESGRVRGRSSSCP